MSFQVYLFKNFYFILYVLVLCLYIYIYIYVYIIWCLVPMGVRSGCWALWFRSHGHLPCGCWALTSGPFQGLTLLLIAESSFHPSLSKCTSKRHALLFSPISRSLTHNTMFHAHENESKWQTSVPNHIHKEHRQRKCLRSRFSFSKHSNYSVGLSPKSTRCSELLENAYINVEYKLTKACWKFLGGKEIKQSPGVLGAC